MSYIYYYLYSSISLLAVYVKDSEKIQVLDIVDVFTRYYGLSLPYMHPYDYSPFGANFAATFPPFGSLRRSLHYDAASLG